MTTQRLLTLAALLAATATLQGCDFGRHSSTEALFTALGAPLPAALDDAPAPAPVVTANAETPVVPDIAPAAIVETPVVAPVVVPPPPPPLQYGDPGYVPAYNQKGYTGPEPCPGSVFRVLTCDDNGQDWHWLDSNMNWIN